MRSVALPAALGLVLVALASVPSYELASSRASRPYDVLHVPSGAATRIAALGHRTFASDLYWLQLVQYVGDSRAEQRGWYKLFPLADLVTDLDPRHGYAYQTAGIVLSASGLLDESDAILQKGIDRGPRRWTYPYYISFNHWFYRGDYPTAARYAELAARTPGASPNVSHLAVSLASKSGTPEDAVALLEELRATAQDEVTAGRLDEQLKLATLERDAQALERAAARFREARGRPIRSLDELVVAGLVASIPPDPFGGAYVWVAAEARVHSSANPFRFGEKQAPEKPAFQYQPPGSAPSGVLR